MFKNHRGLPSTTMLFARALVGGYLLYLAYGLFDGVAEKSHAMWIVLFAVLFTVVGVGVLYFTLQAFLKGNYEGGPNDYDKDEEVSSEAKEIEKTEETVEIEESENTEE